MEPIDFIGKVCPYCRCEFVPGDDIIICSDCDMPHHRDCWVENQGCTTFGCQGTIKSIDRHASSVVTEAISFEDLPTLQPTTIYCSKCGAPSNSSFAFCSACGSPLIMPQQTATFSPANTVTQYSPPTPVHLGTYSTSHEKSYYCNPHNPTDTIDPDVVQLVGVKTEFYLSKFQEIKKENKKNSWNWSAFLFGPWWMIYRKMYDYGAAALAGAFVLGLIGSVLTSFLSLGLYIAYGVLGNYLYLCHLEKRAQQANMIKDSHKAQYMAKHLGVNKVAVILVLVGYGFFTLLFLG